MVYSSNVASKPIIFEAEIVDRARHTITNVQATLSDSSISEPARPRRSWTRSTLAALALTLQRELSPSWMPQKSNGIVSPASPIPADVYARIAIAIDRLSGLDQDDSAFIEPEAHEAGLKLLRQMQSVNVPPPQIFSHGGDSLVFTWEIPGGKRYVTPIDGLARVREFRDDAPGEASQALNFDLSDQGQQVRLLRYVGGSEWSTSQFQNSLLK